MRTIIRTERFVARLTPEEVEQVKALAEKLGTTKTNAVVRAVEIALIHLPEEGANNGEEESAH